MVKRPQNQIPLPTHTQRNFGNHSMVGFHGSYPPLGMPPPPPINPMIRAPNIRGPPVGPPPPMGMPLAPAISSIEERIKKTIIEKEKLVQTAERDEQSKKAVKNSFVQYLRYILEEKLQVPPSESGVKLN